MIYAFIDYTNWRGERRARTIRPHALVLKESPWHSGVQWILEAWDGDTLKDFSMSGIHSWSNVHEVAEATADSNYGDAKP